MSASCGTIVVEPGDTGGVVRIADCSIDPGTLDVGQTVTFSATVQNDTQDQQTVTVNWVATRMTGSPILASDSVTVGSGQSAEVSATFTPQSELVSEVEARPVVQ